MNVISASGRFDFLVPRPFLAIGVFDGVHRGHQVLIKQVVQKAKARQGTSVVMTFHPHPVQVLHPEFNLPLLTTLPDRLKLIEALGVDICWVMRFTQRFSCLTPKKFVDRYLVAKIKPAEIFVGDDFRFGQHRRGHLELLHNEGKKFGFKVNIVRSFQVDEYDVSSSLIRRLVLEGDLTEAGKLLGRPFHLTGQVCPGDKRGQKLGFPTANILISGVVVPPRGVYLSRVLYRGERLPAVTNIGYRPTFASVSPQMMIETHILDFKRNLYKQNISVEFLKRIRNEKKFHAQETLISQIKNDIDCARNHFVKESGA